MRLLFGNRGSRVSFFILCGDRGSRVEHRGFVEKEELGGGGGCSHTLAAILLDKSLTSGSHGGRPDPYISDLLCVYTMKNDIH